MSAPYQVNFKRVRNNVDLYAVIDILSAPDTPISIATAQFFMQVRPKIGAGAPVLDLSLGDGLSLYTDGTDGKLEIHVDHLVMEAVPLGNYNYDLVMVRGGLSEVVFYGTFKVVDGITDLA